MSDLDSRNSEFEKGSKMSKGEIFESGHVAVLDASLLLGRLVIRRGDEENVVDSEASVPAAKNLCYRYYLHQEKDILHLFDSENMTTRGLECSQRLQQYGELKKLTYKYLDLPTPENEGSGNSKNQNMLNLPPHSMHVKYREGEKTFYSSCFLTYPWSMLSHKSLICPIERRGDFPKWQLCVGDVIAVPCNSSKPPCGVDRVIGRDKWYPYSQPWSHAQVIAIYRNDVSRTDITNEPELSSVFASEVLVRVRWLNRISEAISETTEEAKVARLQKIADDPSRTAERLLEGKELTEISCDLILGPIRLDDLSSSSPRKKGYVPSCEDNSHVSLFMVQNRRVIEANNRETFLCRGLAACDLTSKSQMISYRDNIIAVRKKRMEETREVVPNVATTGSKNKALASNSAKSSGTDVDDSGKKNLPQKRRLFDDKSPAATQTSPRKKKAMHESDVNESGKKSQVRFTPNVEVRPVNDLAEADSSDEIPRVFCTTKPFHVDVSSMKSFYTEIEIKPPLDSYDHTILSKIKSTQQPWIVKMGDTGKFCLHLGHLRT